MAAEIIAHDDPDWCAVVADAGFLTEVGIGGPVWDNDVALDQVFSLAHRPSLLAWLLCIVGSIIGLHDAQINTASFHMQHWGKLESDPNGILVIST